MLSVQSIKPSINTKKGNPQVIARLLLLTIALFLGFLVTRTSLAGPGSEQPPALNNGQTVDTQPTPTPHTAITAIDPKSFAIEQNDYPVRFAVTGVSFPTTTDPLKGEPEARIILKVGNVQATTTGVSEDGKVFYAEVSSSEKQNITPGIHPVTVLLDNHLVPVNNPAIGNFLNATVTSREVPIANTTLFAFLSLVITIGVTLLLIQSQAERHCLSQNQRKLNMFQRALLDPATCTYSLARTQFAWWAFIILWGFVFLFMGWWVAHGTPTFPTVAGFAYTLLISVGTLIAAETATGTVGSKGAGPEYPQLSDLVRQGGVLALDRVQQVAWNAVVGVMYIVIILSTYSQSSTFPTIPAEILALMGVSAAGYIGGKIARGPGPVLNRYSLDRAGNTITLVGEHLSQGGRIEQPDGSGNVPNVGLADAGVKIRFTRDDIPETPLLVAAENVITAEIDPANPRTFAKTLVVRNVPLLVLANLNTTSVTVTNADGQEATMSLKPVLTAENPPKSIRMLGG